LSASPTTHYYLYGLGTERATAIVVTIQRSVRHRLWAARELNPNARRRFGPASVGPKGVTQ